MNNYIENSNLEVIGTKELKTTNGGSILLIALGVVFIAGVIVGLTTDGEVKK